MRKYFKKNGALIVQISNILSTTVQTIIGVEMLSLSLSKKKKYTLFSVSYTHLDVYKRQVCIQRCQFSSGKARQNWLIAARHLKCAKFGITTEILLVDVEKIQDPLRNTIYFVHFFTYNYYSLLSYKAKTFIKYAFTVLLKVLIIFA